MRSPGSESPVWTQSRSRKSGQALRAWARRLCGAEEVYGSLLSRLQFVAKGSAGFESACGAAGVKSVASSRVLYGVVDHEPTSGPAVCDGVTSPCAEGFGTCASPAGVLRGTRLSVGRQSPEELTTLLASAPLEVSDAAIVEGGLGSDELQPGTG